MIWVQHFDVGRAVALRSGLRLQEAARLLRESHLPIKEISARMGYSDGVAFHRAFTRNRGITPARFRSKAPKIT